MADKNKKITVSGEEYILQHPGVKWVIDHTDGCTDARGNLVRSDYIQGLFDNVVVEPADLKIEDFDNVSDMRKVMEKIESFL